MKLRALAFAAGLVISGAASATVSLNLSDETNLGNFGASLEWSESFSVSGAGTIDHSLNFTILENLYAGSGVSDIPLSFTIGQVSTEFKNINNLSAQILDSSNTVHTTFQSAGNGDYLALPANTYFSAGNYTLKIGGSATGTQGGMYMVGAVTTPVPEPETWAMLLVGMGLVGLRVRQKAKASREAALA